MATVTINGKNIEIGDHEKLNVIQAAQRAEVEIPHYCWHPALSVVASCRMCLVEAGDKKPDGSISMQPKLVPGCQTPVKDGSVIITDSKKVKDAQAGTLEYLLLNHPLDCPICDQAGECKLQDFSYKYGHSVSRLQEPKTQKIDKHYIGEQITLFTDRCVMCSRCVRFTREVSGTGELEIINRGTHAEIDIFPGKPCNNKLAGNVVDICPVGALCSKDFLYKQRVWWLRESASVCAGCSTGCSIHVDQNEDHVYRLRPRFNPEAQGHFMCDEGRFGFKYIHSDARLKYPLERNRAGGNGHSASPKPLLWEDLLPKLRERLVKATAEGFVGVLSPMMTCEEAYLLASYLKSLSPKARLALGPVPVVGTDDTYPKDPKGRAIEPVHFTIRAEKCPNRIGVEAVLKHFQGEVIPFAQVLKEVRVGGVRGLYLVGGYPGPWLSESDAEELRKVDLLVVQDILASPLAEQADFVLAAASFAEKEGTFVNHAGLAQLIHKSIKPPEEAWQDGRILQELMQRPGLFHVKTARRELGQSVPFFAPLAEREPGEFGVHLIKTSSAALAAAKV